MATYITMPDGRRVNVSVGWTIDRPWAVVVQDGEGHQWKLADLFYTRKKADMAARGYTIEWITEPGRPAIITGSRPTGRAAQVLSVQKGN